MAERVMRALKEQRVHRQRFVTSPNAGRELWVGIGFYQPVAGIRRLSSEYLSRYSLSLHYLCSFGSVVTKRRLPSFVTKNHHAFPCRQRHAVFVCLLSFQNIDKVAHRLYKIDADRHYLADPRRLCATP